MAKEIKEILAQAYSLDPVRSKGAPVLAGIIDVFVAKEELAPSLHGDAGLIRSVSSPDDLTELYLRPREVARVLGLHTNTVKRWDDRGILPSSIRLGRRGDRRYRKVDIAGFMESQKQVSGSSGSGSR